MYVKHKLGILDHVYPEAQRQAANIGRQKTNQQLVSQRKSDTTSTLDIDSKVGLRLSLTLSPTISPVALPRVTNVRVVDAVSISLLVQKVKHVFDGERQGGSSAHSAEQSLKQIVHKLLQRSLQQWEAWGQTCLCLDSFTSIKRWQEQQAERIRLGLRCVRMLHLCCQQPCQVYLWHHLAAPLALLLVPVVVVLDQVPNFDPALQVRGQHGHAGVWAVRAGRRGAEWYIHTLHRKTHLFVCFLPSCLPAVCKKKLLVYWNGKTFPRFVSEKQAVSLKICFWESEGVVCLFIGCHRNSTNVLTFTENIVFSLCPSWCFFFFFCFFFAFCSLFSPVSVTLFITFGFVCGGKRLNKLWAAVFSLLATAWITSFIDGVAGANFKYTKLFRRCTGWKNSNPTHSQQRTLPTKSEANKQTKTTRRSLYTAHVVSTKCSEDTAV